MPVEKVKWQKIWKLGLMGLGIALVLLTGLGIYQQHKPLPQGISQRFPLHNSNQIEFLADYTYSTPTGERKTKQSIFNQVLSLIQQAQKTIILDMFLFNDYQGDSPEKTRAISGELAEALIAQKQKFKALDILVISDPINSLYGGLNASLFQKLSAAGIQVITTDLRPLRDSNPSWSVFWRLGIQWFGNNTEAGWLPSPVGPGLVTLRSYFALLNFKANHRKTLVVDQGKTWTGLVTSANPHDGSSAHGNVALRFNGPAVRDLIESEYAVARLSGANPPIQLPEIPSGNEDN